MAIAENELGVISVFAVPVFDIHRGDIRHFYFAVDVTAKTDRRKNLLKPLRETARASHNELGYRSRIRRLTPWVYRASDKICVRLRSGIKKRWGVKLSGILAFCNAGEGAMNRFIMADASVYRVSRACEGRLRSVPNSKNSAAVTLVPRIRVIKKEWPPRPRSAISVRTRRAAGPQAVAP